MKQCKEMWQEIFGDTTEYVEYYFANKAKRSTLYRDEVGDELASMAFFTPYAAYYRGKRCEVPYIVGVATKPLYRGEKRMTKLLTKGVKEWFDKGAPFVFLSPASAEIYTPLGFQGIYQRETTEVRRVGKEHYLVKDWKTLTSHEKTSMISFVAEKLEAFDLYLEHSLSYYEEVQKELEALAGSVLVLFQGEKVMAVANYIHEENYEITELICHRGDAEAVVDSLLAYAHTDYMVFEDSYFISEWQGEGISRKKQKEPYIMWKTKEHTSEEICSCYINDIT